MWSPSDITLPIIDCHVTHCRVSDASGKLVVTDAGKAPLKREMLDTNVRFYYYSLAFFSAQLMIKL